MTISEMTDAELDRAIAEKRGWKYLETPFGNGWETPHDAKGYYTIKNRIPRFTTDPRYAMELLKEMKAHLDCVLQLSEIYQWICSPKHTKILVFADTPERAIAEAYLEWAK